MSIAPKSITLVAYQSHTLGRGVVGVESDRPVASWKDCAAAIPGFFTGRHVAVPSLDNLVTIPGMVKHRNGKVISTDSDGHMMTCDVCHLLWPDTALDATSGAYECPLCRIAAVWCWPR